MAKWTLKQQSKFGIAYDLVIKLWMPHLHYTSKYLLRKLQDECVWCNFSNPYSMTLLCNFKTKFKTSSCYTMLKLVHNSFIAPRPNLFPTHICILCEVTNIYISNSCGFQTSTFAVQGLNYISAVVISSAGANILSVHYSQFNSNLNVLHWVWRWYINITGNCKHKLMKFLI